MPESCHEIKEKRVLYLRCDTVNYSIFFNRDSSIGIPNYHKYLYNVYLITRFGYKILHIYPTVFKYPGEPFEFISRYRWIYQIHEKIAISLRPRSTINVNINFIPKTRVLSGIFSYKTFLKWARFDGNRLNNHFSFDLTVRRSQKQAYSKMRRTKKPKNNSYCWRALFSLGFILGL